MLLPKALAAVLFNTVRKTKADINKKSLKLNVSGLVPGAGIEPARAKLTGF
jgi:hypothetical protein